MARGGAAPPLVNGQPAGEPRPPAEHPQLANQQPQGGWPQNGQLPQAGRPLPPVSSVGGPPPMDNFFFCQQNFTFSPICRFLAKWGLFFAK